MQHPPGRQLFAMLIATTAALATLPAQGEITDIVGSSSATVVEFNGVFPVQSDFGQAIIPLTTPEPPATAQAMLDRYSQDGTTTAAGQVLAILDQPLFGAFSNPNDVGLDLGAFSDDDVSSWYVEGVVNETRSIVLNANEVGGDLRTGDVGTALSNVTISGVLVITALDMAKDLSGTEVRFRIMLTKRQSGELPTSLMEGEIVMSGGPNGEVAISSATGVFEGRFLPMVDFVDTLSDLPLVRALPIAGLQLPYEYNYTVGEPFQLDLTVSSQLRTNPGGIGAAAVFGLPQEGLAAVLARVKNDDRGSRLATLISQEVDTTGVAYIQGPSAPSIFPICGMFGVETGGALLAGCWLMALGRRRMRSAASGA